MRRLFADGGWRSRAVWQSTAVVSTGLLLLAVRPLEPTFWLIGDKRSQYLPAFQDIGRRLLDGEFPSIAPNLGTGGNFALDLQYGLFEPSHWLVAIALAGIDGAVLAGFLWAAAYLMILALGTTCLTMRLEVTGPWSAVAGVAAATSGFAFFYLAPSWIPGLMSLAWLPWFWWAWVGPLRPRRCVAIGGFSYLVTAGGWPATWLMYGALVTGLLCESVALRDRTAPRSGWIAPLTLRAAAAVSGLIAASLTVLPLAGAADYTVRREAVANTNMQVANLADILGFAGPYLRGDLRNFSETTTILTPIYFAVWFALPLLWLIEWRPSLSRARGVITGAVATGLMLLLTQAPSSLGPIRSVFRQLAGVQFFFAVTVIVVAGAARLAVSRARATGVGLSLLATAWLSWARDPQSPAGLWTVALVGVGAAAVVFGVAWGRGHAAPAVALVGTLLFTALAFALNPLTGANVDTPLKVTPGELSFTHSDEPILAIYPRAGTRSQAATFSDGVGIGFQRLSPDARFAPGSSSIRQRAFSRRFCIKASQGYTCPDAVTALFREESVTDRPWIDLLGYRTVLVGGAVAQQSWLANATSKWHEVGRGQEFVEYRRAGPAAVAGRVTDVVGDAQIREIAVSRKTQSYRVSTARGATLVFRDLYWPGYRASLNGRPIQVRTLKGMLVTVELPPGANGRLTLTYAPLSKAALIGVPGLAVVLLLGVVVGTARYRRRRPSSERSGRVHGDQQEDEPDRREPLQHSV